MSVVLARLVHTARCAICAGAQAAAAITQFPITLHNQSQNTDPGPGMLVTRRGGGGGNCIGTDPRSIIFCLQILPVHLLHSCSHSAAHSAVPRKLRSTGALCGLQRYIGLVIHLGRLLDPLIDVDDPFTTVTAQNSRVQRRELGWVVFLLSLSRDLTPDMHRDTQHSFRSTSQEAVVISSWSCLY